MWQVAENYWSILINILIQKYFADLTTTCILWPQNFPFELETTSNHTTVMLQINPLKLNESFEDNIYNFSRRDAKDNKNNVYYNDLIKKLIAAIEQSHCEGFVAFQDDIIYFSQAFQKASIYSVWRSMNNRFLFGYTKDEARKDYFQASLFKNQFNILVIEANFKNSSIFHLKTNKFVGSKSDHPEELIHLSTFYAVNYTFVPDINLFPAEKLHNLKGREIVAGAFDYRPFVAVDFKRSPLYYDQASDNPSHLVHADGAEIRTCHIFCEIYNCTIHFDTSEKEDWGLINSNYSGSGLIGMIMEDKIQMAFGAIFSIHTYYEIADFSVYIGRSGVTCLVPAAASVVSWYLPLRPFELTLWLAVLGCLCLEVIVLFVTRKFEQNINDHPTTWWSCVKFGYATTLRLFINQGSQYLVQSHTVRTFLFACYMFDIILTSIYGGGLSALLTLPTFGESADTVEKLIKYNLTWTGASYTWLESINDTQEDKNSIYKTLINNFELNTMDDIRVKAQTSKSMGFIIERATFGHFGGGDFITLKALENLKLMLEDIYSQFAVATVSRLWPFLQKYNDLLLQWHASGLDKFWEWKSTAEYLNANQQNQVEASRYYTHDIGPSKLNIQNFAGLILLWIVGMLLSVGVFVMEIICHKWAEWKKQKKNKGRNGSYPF